MSRISLVLLYRRIFIQQWFRAVCWFLIFCYAGYALGSAVADVCAVSDFFGALFALVRHSKCRFWTDIVALKPNLLFGYISRICEATVEGKADSKPLGVPYCSKLGLECEADKQNRWAEALFRQCWFQHLNRCYSTYHAINCHLETQDDLAP